MNFKVFTTLDSRGKRTYSNTIRTITFNRRTHSANFSSAFSRELAGLDNKRNVYLALDEDTKKDWYVTFGDMSDGFRLSMKKRKTPTQSDLYYFCCGEVCIKFLTANGAKTTCSCLISEKAVEVNGVKWYKIVTSKPIRKK